MVISMKFFGLGLDNTGKAHGRAKYRAHMRILATRTVSDRNLKRTVPEEALGLGIETQRCGLYSFKFLA
jgi:hypothetical protein